MKSMEQPQNIFDCEEFYQGYTQLRASPNNYNVLLEHPAILSLMPELQGKSVLDLGCGFGENCVVYCNRGAQKVVGIDCSERMLAVAKQKHSHPAITYLQLEMERLHQLSGCFDVVVSSLAFHYIQDFDQMLEQINRLLVWDGILVFSQEHPLTTAPKQDVEFVIEKEKIYYPLSDYANPGKREISWFVDGVLHYHRTFSQIINALIQHGFVVEEMKEPLPSQEALDRLPQMAKEWHKPSFLLIRAKKVR